MARGVAGAELGGILGEGDIDGLSLEGFILD
jgi:hypothetical protein